MKTLKFIGTLVIGIFIAGNLMSCSNNTGFDDEANTKRSYRILDDTTIYVTADKSLTDIISSDGTFLDSEGLSTNTIARHLKIKGKVNIYDMNYLLSAFATSSDLEEMWWNEGRELHTEDVDMSSAQSTTSSIGGEGVSWDRKEQNSWFIKSLKLPQGIETIYSGYFSKSKNLEHIILPESIKGISNQAFSYCMSLKEIELPDNLEEIGQEAFSYCMSLKDIKFPENNLEEIGEWAFYSCRSLSTITLSSNLKTIGQGAFYECTSLKDIKLPENNLEEIGEWAFYSCSSLTSITIPKSIKKIGEGAFDKSGLTEIHMKSIIPPDIFNGNTHIIGGNIFPLNRYGEYITTLYVPKGSKNAYSKQWPLLKIIEE